MHKVTVSRLDILDTETGESRIDSFIVRQGHLLIRKFLLADFEGDAKAAEVAARDYTLDLRSQPWISPFKTHYDLLTKGAYSTARNLGSLVLHLGNHENPLELGRLLRNADEHHLKIAFELMKSYAQFGENDYDFMDACYLISNARLQQELHKDDE